MLLRRRHRQVEPSEVEAPGGSAKKAEWFAYAVHVGVSVEDLEGLTRDQIKDAVAEATADPDAEKAAAELAAQEAVEAEAKEKADAEAAEVLAAAAELEANGETTPEVEPTEPTE